MLAVYVAVAMCLLTVHGFLRLRRSDDLGELLFVTVFFQLSIPVLHAPLTRMDAYGLYSIGDFARHLNTIYAQPDCEPACGDGRRADVRFSPEVAILRPRRW